MRDMEDFKQIIRSWPSDSAMAEDLGVSQGAVAMWKHRNSIPPRYWVDTVKAAKKRKIKLTLEGLHELGIWS